MGYSRTEPLFQHALRLAGSLPLLHKHDKLPIDEKLGKSWVQYFDLIRSKHPVCSISAWQLSDSALISGRILAESRMSFGRLPHLRHSKQETVPEVFNVSRNDCLCLSYILHNHGYPVINAISRWFCIKLSFCFDGACFVTHLTIWKLTDYHKKKSLPYNILIIHIYRSEAKVHLVLFNSNRL